METWEQNEHVGKTSRQVTRGNASEANRCVSENFVRISDDVFVFWLDTHDGAVTFYWLDDSASLRRWTNDVKITRLQTGTLLWRVTLYLQKQSEPNSRGRGFASCLISMSSSIAGSSWATTFVAACLVSSGVSPGRWQFGSWAAVRHLLSAASGSSLLAAVIQKQENTSETCRDVSGSGLAARLSWLARIFAATTVCRFKSSFSFFTWGWTVERSDLAKMAERKKMLHRKLC